MKPFSCNLIRSTAAACLLMVSGYVQASDGVVRVSDQSAVGRSAARVNSEDGTRLVSHTAECGVPEMVCGEPFCAAPECCVTGQGCEIPCEGWGGAVCSTGGACDNSGECYGYGSGHHRRMRSLYADSDCHGSGCRHGNSWREQSMRRHARHNRLCNCLFGWMIPSGFCGQGCPPVGKYQITYADQPDYFDPRDGQLYAAQGSGMPMTVPLAPTVRYAYNYSSTIPASRITQISNYNPMTSPQTLYHQSW